MSGVPSCGTHLNRPAWSVSGIRKYAAAIARTMSTASKSFLALGFNARPLRSGALRLLSLPRRLLHRRRFLYDQLRVPEAPHEKLRPPDCLLPRAEGLERPVVTAERPAAGNLFHYDDCARHRTHIDRSLRRGQYGICLTRGVYLPGAVKWAGDEQAAADGRLLCARAPERHHPQPFPLHYHLRHLPLGTTSRSMMMIRSRGAL